MKTVQPQSRLPKTYRITRMKRETAYVTTMTFGVSFASKPGQFVMVWLPGFDEKPMSVAADDGKELRITFFAVGPMTKALAEKRVEDLVGLRGPFGTHYAWERSQRLILVAGGYGAAPMSFAAREAAEDGCTIDFIVGARSKEHLLYLDEIAKLPRTTLHIATDDGSQGHRGYCTEVLEEVIKKSEIKNQKQIRKRKSEKNLKSAISVFACGPEMMLKRVSDICSERDVPAFLSLERYMKCGCGLCGSCVVDPLGIRLCTDGPVVSNGLCRRIAEFGAYHRDSVGRKEGV